MLEIKNLCFAFAANNKPLFFDHTSFTCAPGTINFIQGSNGSGKSTLLRIIQGNIEPTEHCTATATLNGKNYTIANQQQRAFSFHNNVATVHQKFDAMLAHAFSGTVNLKLANVSSIPHLAALPARKKIDAFSNFCKTLDLEKPVGLLSGGQRQILAIMMALQKPKEILLLDEPTSALDETNSTMVFNFLTTLVKTTPIIVVVVCHDTDVINAYSEGNVVQLGKGRGQKASEKA